MQLSWWLVYEWLSVVFDTDNGGIGAVHNDRGATVVRSKQLIMAVNVSIMRVKERSTIRGVKASKMHHSRSSHVRTPGHFTAKIKFGQWLPGWYHSVQTTWRDTSPRRLQCCLLLINIQGSLGVRPDLFLRFSDRCTKEAVNISFSNSNLVLPTIDNI
jgi:hypothetical protein